MENRMRYRPFTNDETVKVRLTDAPLELVIAQVRWPEFGHLQGDMEPIASELGRLLVDYPRYAAVPELSFTITPQGVQPAPAGTIYQWESIDRAWHVSFTKRFLSLYCTDYSTYEEFDFRLRQILEHVNSVVKVQLVDRVGVRYVNRISSPETMERLTELVRPEVLGYLALPLAGSEVSLAQGLNQALFNVGAAHLQVRSGVVPPGETVDAAVPALGVSSWILDFDAFDEAEGPFDVESIALRAGRLSDTAYDFFKYVVNASFIEQFGGSVEVRSS